MLDRKAYIRAYTKEWRKKHPHYQRDWMRANRTKDYVPKMRVILGVPVNWRMYS